MSRAAMQLAFDAMSYGNTDEREAARIALREALAQQDAENHLQEVSDFGQLQERREWVKLTDEEIEAIVDLHTSDSQGYDIWCDGRCVAADVEAKLKDKNT